jgi:hypothetical protein
MKATLKKTLLAALPLAGLLFFPLSVSAHDDEHGALHDDLNAMHREFHNGPYNKQEHKRFHKWAKRQHKDFHRDAWYERHGYDNGDWYRGRQYYGNDYYRRRGQYCPPNYYGSSGYYGNSPYYGNGSYYGNGGYYGGVAPWLGLLFGRY